MGGRYARLKHLTTLDPAADHQEIHRLVSKREFPWDYGRGLEMAMWRICCVPRISAVLDGTAGFHLGSQRRYDDTRILLAEIVTGGYDSARGRQALQQINRAHHGLNIPNDDMLYVLSAFVFEPVRWIDRWAWRKLSETERLGSFYFFRVVGHRLGVRDIPADYDAFESFNRSYEASQFGRAETNRAVGQAILDLYTSWYPRIARSPAREILTSRLDAPAIEALGLRPPPAHARAANWLILRAHALAERLAPVLMARLLTRPVARSYPGYPRGYDLGDIGRKPAAAPCRRSPACASNASE